VNDPHPQYGSGYPIGKVFAIFCGRPKDIAFIGLGSGCYAVSLDRLLPVIRQANVA